ncbi:MAG: hypothetical protein KKD56_11320, partial [Acidobacteria bacterium]|nr:hypothetical protein [Acidobacteriota bacterium]
VEPRKTRPLPAPISTARKIGSDIKSPYSRGVFSIITAPGRCQPMRTGISDSATFSKKAEFLLRGPILIIRSFGLKKIQAIILTKMGLFSQKGILFH